MQKADSSLVLAATCAAAPFHARAQDSTGVPADPNIKYSTALPAGIGS